MTIINNVTTNFGWPLPNQANYLSDDVGRLITALQDIDAAVAATQPTLVSGSNIKTINGGSILGSGNLTVTGGISWVKKTAAYTAANYDGVLADTSAGAWTLTLPASPTAGMQVSVADNSGSWATNNLTVNPGTGVTIASQASGATLVLDVNNTLVSFVHDGSKWDVFAQTLQPTSSPVPSVVVVTSTTVAMAAAGHYVLTASGATTATLPASPNQGDMVWVSTTNGLTTNTIARNGNPIQGGTNDLLVDTGNTTVRLRYINSTLGWVLV